MHRAALVVAALVVTCGAMTDASRSATPRASADAALMTTRLAARSYAVTPIMQSGVVAGLDVAVPGVSGAVVSIYPMDGALDALRLSVGMQPAVTAHPGRVAVTLRATHVYVARVAAPATLPGPAIATIVRVAEGDGRFPSAGGVLHSYLVPSPSMEPAIRHDSLVLFAASDFTIQRGGIYVIHPNGPDGATTSYVKRVVGMPGDWIEGVHGLVRICASAGERDCRNLDERYVSSEQDAFPLTRVPPGHYFVMGDNRAFSDDSRDWGSIRGAQVVARFVQVLR